jgi:hypothetical protein
MAAQVIARMYYEHGFDFGIVNYGVERSFVRPERYPQEYRYAEHPVAQFPEPLRSELMGRSSSLSEPLGHLDFDVPGTVAGGWFLQGTPTANSLDLANDHRRQWFGRWIEREETRVVAFGHPWPGLPNRVQASSLSAPAWEEITPSSGRVAIQLWWLDFQALPINSDASSGTVLLELLDATTLRVEWFPHHDPVSEFTAAALDYER